MNEYTEKQRKKIKETFLQSLENGVSNTKACNGAGVCRYTIWKWRLEDKEFDQKVNMVIDSRTQVIEDELFNNAKGYETKDKDGNVKNVGGNVVAQIFWLKNRSNGRWKDKQDIELGGEVKIHNARQKLIDRIDSLASKSKKKKDTE